MNLNKCRLCYENEAHVKIFERNDDPVTILAKIKACCGTLKIEENDGFPPSICRPCQLELDAYYLFVVKCEAADKKMRYLSDDFCGDFELVGSHEPEVKIELNDDGLASDFYDADETNPLSELPQHVEVKQEQVDLQTQDAGKKQYKKRLKLSKASLVCSVCGRRCQSSSALSTHMRTHSNERPFQCVSCDKTYKDRGTLNRHVERNHLKKRERKFICEHCGKGFYSKTDIQIHMRVHTGETPYTCIICQARFSQVSAMLRHKRRHTGEKPYACATCGKLFWTKHELKKHFSVHEDVRQFSCSICQVQFKNKHSLQKHTRAHSESNHFVCSHCGQTFKAKGNLNSHVARKHSEKSGHCNICLKNVSNIKVHMWRHTGQRPLKCELCTSSFYEAKALGHHINFKHKNTDKYKCTFDGCTKSFPSNPMLSFHVAKFHEQHAPHPCARCSRRYYRKNDLARHMLSTHKERLLD